MNHGHALRKMAARKARLEVKRRRHRAAKRKTEAQRRLKARRVMKDLQARYLRGDFNRVTPMAKAPPAAEPTPKRPGLVSRAKKSLQRKLGG